MKRYPKKKPIIWPGPSGELRICAEEVPVLQFLSNLYCKRKARRLHKIYTNKGISKVLQAKYYYELP